MTETSGRYLINAPLKEVVFQLNWELDFSVEQKTHIDKGFETAVLKFAQSCQQEYNEVEVLKPAFLPSTAFIKRVTHRFYKILGEHPLYQIGPGVFTVNDNNKNYKWNDFNEMIVNGFGCLKNSYQKELIPERFELRYIDRVFINDIENIDVIEFAKKHLNISVDDNNFVEGELENFAINKNFNLDNVLSLNLYILSGNENNSNFIEWHTSVTNKISINWDNINETIEKAHNYTSETFKKMISDELFEYFSKQ